MRTPTKKQTAFRIDTEILARLQAVKARDGIPVSEQVRRALGMWFERKDIESRNAGRKRAVTRKRP